MRSDIPDGQECGVCGADAPPLLGSVLTGVGLSVAEAAEALERGEELPLTPVQRVLVETWATEHMFASREAREAPGHG
jgi:hypothetical protein